MAYSKGDIEIGTCYYDARENDGYDKSYRFREKTVIQLPHSCDEWIIGGIEEARQMIIDLEEAIKIYSERNKEEHEK